MVWNAGENRTFFVYGKYYAKLDDRDDSLTVYYEDGETDSIVYTSNVGDPETLDDIVEPPSRLHRLTISEERVLTIYRGGIAVWTNNRLRMLDDRAGISVFLQNGEMMHVNICYRTSI